MSIIDFDRMVFYIFLLLIVSIINSSKVYKIPFCQSNDYINISSYLNSDLAESLLQLNELYVNLSLGNPPQKIPFQLNMNSQTFYVSKKYYNPNQSNTCELFSYKDNSYYFEDLIKGFHYKDYIQINNNRSMTKIDFIYAAEIKQENNRKNMGNIGLLIPSKNIEDVYPFFSSLKKAEIINSYSWTLKFFRNISIFDTIYNYGKEGKYIGEFIIGDDPHNYEENKKIYNESTLRKVNAISDFNGLYWDIYFDSSYIKLKINNHEIEEKITIEGYKFVELDLDVGFIIGPSEFFNIIKKNFFNKYQTTCKEKELINIKFKYYECDSSNFTLSSFPNIYFESKQLESIFNLTYKDLFILDEKNNKYLFLIINSRYVNKWIFGTIFLKKYQFVFNIDTKTIGYYKSFHEYAEINYNNKNENKEEGESNKDNNIKKAENINKDKINVPIYIFVIGIILIIFNVAVIIIYMQKKFFNNKRKRRVNELENEYNDMNKRII